MDAATSREFASNPVVVVGGCLAMPSGRHSSQLRTTEKQPRLSISSASSLFRGLMRHLSHKTFTSRDPIGEIRRVPRSYHTVVTAILYIRPDDLFRT